MTHVSDNPPDPEDDIDFISEDGVTGTTTEPLGMPSPAMGHPNPVLVPKESTPLAEEGDEVSIPRCALWSMKYLRGTHPFANSEAKIRIAFGRGDSTVYVLDDGRKHCLISREVGSASDGSTYCLVAQIQYSEYERLVDGASTAEVFADATTFSLCSVYDAEDADAVSNVTVIGSYETSAEIPSKYLPPHPPITFAEGDEPS